MKYRICKLRDKERYTIQKKLPLFPIWCFIYDMDGYHGKKISTYPSIEEAKERLQEILSNTDPRTWLPVKD